jgi:lipid II:glycine glycyltransferase (peptidoglycan interpeptide bridge formation enzyme)
VVEGDGSDLERFYGIHADAMSRGGVPPRAITTYRDTWDELAPRGMARLLFARAPSAGPVATVFLVSCGPRIVDLYSGTTPEGDRLRANYLLKWESISRSKVWGFGEYDFWGLPRAGIAEFKQAFGGRQVDYVGAWELDVDPVGARVLRAAQAARKRYLKARRRRAVESE